MPNLGHNIGDLKVGYMLETLMYPLNTQGGENFMVETISRKDVNSAWLAGAFEGEGCVYAYFKSQTNPNCTSRMTLTMGATIYNTHPLFIARITEVLAELGIPFNYIVSQRKNGDRPGAAINIQGKGRAKKFYKTVLPYLASKKKQAELVLELIEYRESLVSRNHGSKGIFKNMTLLDDKNIKHLCEAISREKHDFPSVLKFSRKQNIPFDVSSTTNTPTST